LLIFQSIGPFTIITPWTFTWAAKLRTRIETGFTVGAPRVPPTISPRVSMSIAGPLSTMSIPFSFTELVERYRTTWIWAPNLPCSVCVVFRKQVVVARSFHCVRVGVPRQPNFGGGTTLMFIVASAVAP
jgi:hypothetical protein